MRKGSSRRTRQVIIDHAGVFECALELEVKEELTRTCAKFLYNLSKRSDAFIRKKGKSFCCRIKLTMKYYQMT